MAVKIQGTSGNLVDIDASGNLKVTGSFTPNGVQNVAIVSGVELEFKNDSGNPLPVVGQVAVSNFPTNTEISNDSGNPVPISGTVTVSNPVSSVVVSNFPASTEISNDVGNPIAVSGTVTISNPVSTIAVSNFPVTQAISGSISVSNLPSTQTVAGSVSVSNFPASQTVSQTSQPLPTGAATSANQVTQIASLASLDSKTILSNNRIQVENAPIANLLGITATGASGAAVTLTLPAVVGQFHYIDSVEVSLYSTTARTGNATPILVSTTNLPGNPVTTWATAATIGQCDTRQLNDATLSIKSSVANTPTTYICPVVTGGLWRLNVIYSTSV